MGMVYDRANDDVALRLAAIVQPQRSGQGSGYRFGAVRSVHSKEPLRFDWGRGVTGALKPHADGMVMRVHGAAAAAAEQRKRGSR